MFNIYLGREVKIVMAVMERAHIENNFINVDCKRGDVFLADLSCVVGSEQGGLSRPVLILQNDVGNRYSPTVIVCVLTSQIDKIKRKNQPTHVYLDNVKNKLEKPSFALLEQIKTIDKRRLIEKVSTISLDDMKKIDEALKISLALN